MVGYLRFTQFSGNIICQHSNIRIIKFFTSDHTEWKFHDFPVIQILREINFGELEAVKLPFLQLQGSFIWLVL